MDYEKNKTLAILKQMVADGKITQADAEKYCPEIVENDRDDVEYVRTDAFIEKVCEWIREFNNHHYIMRYSDSCEPPLSEVTEWFKNYMKGE